jgi:hypothetical protein
VRAGFCRPARSTRKGRNRCLKQAGFNSAGRRRERRQRTGRA